jgi:hypothetical protein
MQHAICYLQSTYEYSIPALTKMHFHSSQIIRKYYGSKVGSGAQLDFLHILFPFVRRIIFNLGFVMNG